MTTAVELAERELVRPASFTLKQGEVRWRRLLLTPEVEEWIVNIYRNNPPTTWEADLTPREQLHGLVRKFVLGAELNFDTEFHVLIPGEDAVWELKTPDLRLFGFFSKLDCMIVVGINFATVIKERAYTPMYIQMVKAFREQHEVDCVWRLGENDVLSVRPR